MLGVKQHGWIYLSFIVIMFWFISRVLYPASQNLTYGFGAYYSAARLLRLGQLSARVYDPVYFRPLVWADSRQQTDDIYNANPPTTALLFWPLTFFSIETARVIWTGANALMLLGGLTLLILTFAGRPRPLMFSLIFGLGLLFQPALENIQVGQAYLLIFFLLTLATIAVPKEQALLGGSSLALALLFKTAGWALLPLLIWQKRWPYLAWTGGLLGAILLLTLPLFPLAMWLSYLQLLGETGNSALNCATSYQTTRSLLCQIFVFDETWNNSSPFNLPWLAIVILVGLALITLAANFKLSHQSHILAFMTTLIWGVIFAPLGEQYHHSVILIPLTWLLIQWSEGKLASTFSKMTLIVAICLYLLPLPLGHPQLQPGWWPLLAYPRLYGAWLLLLSLYQAGKWRMADSR